MHMTAKIHAPHQSLALARNTYGLVYWLPDFTTFLSAKTALVSVFLESVDDTN
jgi:hypothetical protein